MATNMTDMSNVPRLRPPDNPGPAMMMTQVVSISDELRIAAERGHVDIVREILAAGPDFRPNQDGRTALHYSSQEGHTDICTLLISNGCSVNTQDTMGYSPLIRASSQGFQDIVQLLLSSGCDPDLQDAHGNAAIHEACWNGFSKSAEFLTAHNCNVCLSNKAGFTALHLAAQNGHNESSRVLLYAGCGTDLKNNYGDTALHTAARYGHAGVARILISAKCRLDEQNKNGDTSLHIASALKRRKIAKILVESGMDTKLLNKQGETAIDVARRKDHPEIVLIISTYTPSTPSPTKPIQSFRRHGDGLGVTFKDEIELADGPVVCPDETLPLKTEPLKPEKQERFLFFFKKKKKDKEKEKSAQSNLANGGTPDHHHNKSNSDVRQQPHHQPNKPAVHGFFSHYIPRDGVQFYRDLAGNIKQGPIGYAPVCQCGPSLKRLETSILNTRDSLHKCVESSHNTLSHRLDKLNTQSAHQSQALRASMRDGFEQEHNACHVRIAEHLHDERRETHALLGRANADMKDEIESWLNDKLASYGHCLDHHHDDSALPSRNLFLDFPTMGRLVRSRSDETLSVSDYSGRHRKKDFYATRKAAMEQIRAWDMPHGVDNKAANTNERNNNNVKNNFNTQQQMVTMAQVHTPYAANEKTYSSRENVFSQSTNSTTSPGTYHLSNGSRSAKHSFHDSSFSPLPQQHTHHEHMPSTPGRMNRTSFSNNRASSQPRVVFSPNHQQQQQQQQQQPNHTPRSSSSPPSNVVPTQMSHSHPKTAHLARRSSGHVYDQTASAFTPTPQQNLNAGGPPDAVEAKSVEQRASSKSLLNGQDRNHSRNGHTSASSDHSGLTGGESSSNGSRNSNTRTQLTRYQDKYGIRFSSPRTLSSDSLREESPQPIARCRSVENTLEENESRACNSGYVTDSAIRTSRSSQAYIKNPINPQTYKTGTSRATMRYRLPETSAGYHSDMNYSSTARPDVVKSPPPPVLPKRNQNLYINSKPNHNAQQKQQQHQQQHQQQQQQHPKDIYDQSNSNRLLLGDYNATQQGEHVSPPYRPPNNLHGKVESSNYSQLPAPLSTIPTPLTTDCLQHDSFLSPIASPSIPFTNGNKEDSTCSSNQDSGYDSRAHRRICETKDGDTSGGTPSSSFSVERSNCNTPSYGGSPLAMQKEIVQSSDFIKDLAPKRLHPEPYSDHSHQSQFNGLDKSKENNGGNRRSEMSQAQERKTDFFPYAESNARNAQKSVFNSNSRNYTTNQSYVHPSSYVNNDNNKYTTNEYKHPVSAVSHSSYPQPQTPNKNNANNYSSVYGSYNRQHNARNSQSQPNNKPFFNGNHPLGYVNNSERQSVVKHDSDGRFLEHNVNSNLSYQQDAKNKNLPSSPSPESLNVGKNIAHRFSTMPSHSISQIPSRPDGPTYKSPPFSTTTSHFSPSYSERESNMAPINQSRNDSNLVSLPNEMSPDVSRNTYMPVKSLGHTSTNANGGVVDTTQTKVQAHVEGWYQRKLIEAAERLRQNHAYNQPSHGSFGDHPVTNTNHKQSYQTPSYNGWSGGSDPVKNHEPHHRPLAAYQATTPRRDDTYSMVDSSANKMSPYDSRFEQNASRQYEHYRSSPYSSDYNSNSEITTGRLRNSEQVPYRGQLLEDGRNKDFPNFPIGKQNGRPIHYDPIHGSDV